MRYVEFEAGGKLYKLRYDFNAIADLEQRAGAGVVKLFNEEQIGFNTIRMLVWAGLKWSNPGLTVEDAGRVVVAFISDGNTVEDLSANITKALNTSGLFGKPDDEKGDDSEPPFQEEVLPKKSASSKK